MWACGNCREVVEDQFDACWNCGCSREGKLNLDFMREPITPSGDSPLEKSFTENFKCQKCDCREARFARMASTGTGLVSMVSKNFLAVSCENCGYTELYNLTILEGRTDFQDFLRRLFGG